MTKYITREKRIPVYCLEDPTQLEMICSFEPENPILVLVNGQEVGELKKKEDRVSLAQVREGDTIAVRIPNQEYRYPKLRFFQKESPPPHPGHTELCRCGYKMFYVPEGKTEESVQHWKDPTVLCSGK